jgi:hypothetical protein
LENPELEWEQQNEQVLELEQEPNEQVLELEQEQQNGRDQ